MNPGKKTADKSVIRVCVGLASRLNAGAVRWKGIRQVGFYSELHVDN